MKNQYRHIVKYLCGCSLIMFCANFAACKEDDPAADNFIETTPHTCTLDWEGKTSDGEDGKIEVGSSLPWKAIILEEDSWISLSRTEGPAGRQTIFLDLEENTGDKREGIVTFDTGVINPAPFIVVTQEAKTESLLVPSTNITLLSNGKFEDGSDPFIFLNTNCNWSLTTQATWLHLSQTSGERGRNKIAFTADANETEAMRPAEIHVQAGALSETISISQLISGLNPITPIQPISFTASGDIEGGGK